MSPEAETIGDTSNVGPSGKALWRQIARNVKQRSSVLMRFSTLRDMCGDCYIPPEKLDTIKKLGEGAYATVDLCNYETDWGKPTEVAVKRLKPHVFACQKDLRKFLEEARLLMKLSHAYIVELIGVGSLDLEAEDKDWYIVQEYMNRGNLKTLITHQMEEPDKDLYSFNDGLRWMIQVAKGLSYLHNANPRVIHRDLKLENILLGTNGSGECTAKLADFGLHAVLPPRKGVLGKKVQEESEHLTSPSSFKESISQLEVSSSIELSYNLSTQTGSMMYMAPEVLAGETYNHKADVFSFAIVMYEVFRKSIMLAFVSYLGSARDIEMYAINVMSGFRPPIPKEWPSKLQELIGDCWAENPKDRPNMCKVLTKLRAIRDKVVQDLDIMATGGDSMESEGKKTNLNAGGNRRAFSTQWGFPAFNSVDLDEDEVMVPGCLCMFWGGWHSRQRKLAKLASKLSKSGRM